MICMSLYINIHVLNFLIDRWQQSEISVYIEHLKESLYHALDFLEINNCQSNSTYEYSLPTC